MRSSLVYEPIYIVKNLYSDFIILQDSFLSENEVFKWNLVLYKLQQFTLVTPSGAPTIEQYAKKHVL